MVPSSVYRMKQLRNPRPSTGLYHFQFTLRTRIEQTVLGAAHVPHTQTILGTQEEFCCARLITELCRLCHLPLLPCLFLLLGKEPIPLLVRPNVSCIVECTRFSQRRMQDAANICLDLSRVSLHWQALRIVMHSLSSPKRLLKGGCSKVNGKEEPH